MCCCIGGFSLKTVPFTKQKKAVSCTTTWIKADGFYFHSSVSLNVDIGSRSAAGPERAECWALCLREAYIVSAVLELAGTVTLFKFLWLLICLFSPNPSILSEFMCTEMLAMSYSSECVCRKAVAHSCLMGNSWVCSAVLQSTSWRR